MVRFSYTAQMPKEFHAHALDVKAFAEAGAELSGSVSLGDLERLLAETEGRGADRSLAWTARGELRNPLHVQPDVWLHLKAPLTGLIEDEFLMELPLVPLHETCPEPVRLSAADPDFEHESPQENPFAVLARLKDAGRGGAS